MASNLLDRVIFTPVSSGVGNFVVSAAVTGYQTPAQAGAVNATVYYYAAESADKTQWEVGSGAYTVGTTTLARTNIYFNSLGTTAAVNFTNPPNVMVTVLAETPIVSPFDAVIGKTAGASVIASSTTTLDIRLGGLGGTIGFEISASNINAQTGGSTIGTASVPWLSLFLGAANNPAIQTAPANATLQFGAADAAAPVAQTLQVQSVVAGTSNTAGTDWTLQGSRGTGTGAGGNLVFKTAAAGTTGTSQNAATAMFTARADQTIQLNKAFTVSTLPTAGTQGRIAYVTDATAPTYNATLTGGGAVVVPVFDNGAAWVSF